MPVNELEPQTPEWWIARLFTRLDERAARIQLYEDYYDGKQRLRFTTLKMRETFGGQFGSFADNYCRLVVDAVEERLQIRGFRVLDDDEAPGLAEEQEAAEEAAETPEEEAEEEEDELIANGLAWQVWRANDLDSGSQMAHVEALVNEESYLIVWSDPDEPQMPQVTVESPFEVIVDHDPANRRKRRAALKRWVDPDDKKWRAVLYLPDALHKFRSVKAAKDARGVSRPGFWEPWLIEGETWPLPNPLGVVPVIPLTNMPRLTGGGDSEIAPIIPVQDAINKTVTDMLVASEFVAYPQRWMVGVEQPKDENDQPIEPFKAGVNRIWFVERPEGSTINPAIGQFPTSDLTPYTNAVNMFIGHLGSISKTPKHYLVDPGGGTNFTGETLKGLEAGLVAKARRKTRTWSPAYAEMMALAFLVMEQAGVQVPTTDRERIEVIWADVESRTESQHVDSLVKLATLEVPTEQLWADAGYTPQQIERFKEMRKTSPPPEMPVRITEPVTPQQLEAQAATGTEGAIPAMPTAVAVRPAPVAQPPAGR